MSTFFFKQNAAVVIEQSHFYSAAEVTLRTTNEDDSANDSTVFCSRDELRNYIAFLQCWLATEES